MKTILLGCLLGLCGYANGQPASRPQKTAADSMTFYIDSQKVDLKLFFFDVDNIKDISLLSNKMYITWKTPHPVFLTLKDIASRQTGYTRSNILYIIDDSVINDTTNIRIDPSYILRVKYDSTADKNYLSPSYRQMGLILIETKRKNNKVDFSKGDHDSTKEPLIILDKCSYTGHVDAATLNLLNFSNIINVRVLKDNDPKAKAYGEARRNGVILIALKDSVTLIPFTQLLSSKYHLNAGENLKVCVNEELLENPERLMADQNADLHVEVKTGKYRNKGWESPSEEKFINIVTRNPDKKQLYIR